MKPPLNRDQQIDLMSTSVKRHEARFATLAANSMVRAALCRPAPGQDEPVYTVEHKRVACR